jgi:uncharacterized membrane protein YgdD (TMEM256/DUF423 family)
MTWGAVGAVLAFVAVLAGAFGAHALRGHIDEALLAVFETGARYQLVHGLAIVITAIILERHPSRVLSAAALLFTAGSIVFSGSLYALALTGQRWFGAITPFGGLGMLAGWIALAVGMWQSRGH